MVCGWRCRAGKNGQIGDGVAADRQVSDLDATGWVANLHRTQPDRCRLNAVFHRGPALTEPGSKCNQKKQRQRPYGRSAAKRPIRPAG